MPASLDEGAIHLFRANLDRPRIPEAELERLLSAEEVARADRFRFPHLRRHYVTATGLLRLALAEIEGIPADRLVFQRTPHGKPTRPGGPAFNLSHSGTRLLIGFTPEGHLGVDVEAHRPLSDLRRLAEKTFSPAEARDIVDRTSSAERTEVFFRVWTRKEALVKALGLGLSMPLRIFTVSGEPADDDPTSRNALIRVEDREAFDQAVTRALEDRDVPARDWWITPVRPDRAAPTHRGGGPAAGAVAWDRGAPLRLVDLDLG